MRKIIVAISMLLVIAMTLAVPAFGAEEVSTAAVELEKYGQKTYIVGEAVSEAPIIDGVIEEGEYTLKVRFEDEALWTTGESFTTKGEAPEEAWMNSEYIEYYYSWDEDNIYIALVDMHGYKDNTHWVYRTNYYWRFGFNLGDFSEYIQIYLSGNPGDFTSYPERPSIGMTNPRSNAEVPAEENAKIAGYATKVPVDSTLTDMKATDATQWVRTVEMALNKAQLLNMFNFYCGTNYAELPNAMLIAHGNRTYNEFAEVGVADPSKTTHSLWNCAALSDAQMTELGTEFIYVPNVVVFGTELKVPSEASATTAPVETTPVETTPVETTPVETTPVETTPVETENNAGNATETEPAAEGGCGGTVSMAGIALVAALGTCATVVSKKRR